MTRDIRTSPSGFTLIELMVVVAVVAILAAMATGAYGSYIRSGKIAEAFSILNDYHLKLEQFKQDNRSYADPLNTNNCGVIPPAHRYFDFACTLAASGTQFTATASSKAGAGLGNAADYRYSIDHTGRQNTLTFAGGPGPNGVWKNK